MFFCISAYNQVFVIFMDSLGYYKNYYGANSPLKMRSDQKCYHHLRLFF